MYHVKIMDAEWVILNQPNHYIDPMCIRVPFQSKQIPLQRAQMNELGIAFKIHDTKKIISKKLECENVRCNSMNLCSRYY